ncbi:hypothetical protein E0K89_019355 [Aquicoccus sp. SCR17]|nr:hypothetical protein [Carideicomes alvinocaridis]
MSGTQGEAAGTLWLHVGTHKTGTTSIQRALSLRGPDLAAAGVALGPDENAWALANLFLRPELRTTPRVKGRTVPRLLADSDTEIERLAEARGALPDMVISSEEFCMMRTGLEALALHSTLGARFARIRPVLVLRGEAEWRASREDQLRKTGLWEIQQGLPEAQSVNGEWYYDREAIFDFWRAIGPVTVIDYDDAVAREGTILPAFARAIERPGLFGGVDLRLNQRRGRAA